MIIIKSFAILLFLFWLGLPLSFFCLRKRRPSLYLLLAPHCGLAVLAIVAVNAYLLNFPVSRIVLPVICLCLLNGIGTVFYLFKGMRSAGTSFPDLVSRITTPDRAFLIPTFLFALACLIYVFPFILNPNMVFYAYGGTDGYAYMGTAEYQMSHGVYDAPSADLYRVHSGLIKALTNIADNVMDKPGTMVVLAFIGSLFSGLPQELFSPLMLSYVFLTFPSVFALAQSLGYAPILSGLAAFLSTVSPSVLALSSNTYFSATITVSLLPTILVLAQDIFTHRMSGVGFAVMYTAYFLFSPPSFMIPIAATFPYIAYSAFQHLRRGVKTVLVNGMLPIGCFLILNLLTYKIYMTSLRYYFTHAFGPRLEPMDSLLRRYSWNMFWHTLGIGPVIASPFTRFDTFVLIALVAVFGAIVLLGALYLARSVVRRDFSILFFSYLSFWLVVLIGGVGRAFQSFEVLSRVSQQFVPLHSLVYVSFLNKKEPIFWEGRLRRLVLGSALLVVMICPFAPFGHFQKRSLLDHPQRVNQHFQSSFRAREDIVRIVGESPVLLNSSVPTHTGVLNIATLFTNIRLAIPPAFLKFFFLDKVPTPDDYFCAPTVLTSEFYVDIYENDHEKILYRQNGFRLSKNDLILFFDNDTFTIKNGFDVEFLKKRRLVQSRELRGNTMIHVCSREARTVRLTFRHSPLENQQVFNLRVNPSFATSKLVFWKEGALTTPSLPLSPGVNRIELEAKSAGDPVEILRISMKASR
jgi:hypothetical protein